MIFGGAYGDACMPNWPHWHRTPLPGIATTGLRRDKITDENNNPTMETGSTGLDKKKNLHPVLKIEGTKKMLNFRKTEIFAKPEKRPIFTLPLGE